MTYTAEQFAQLSLLHLRAIERAERAERLNVIYQDEFRDLKEKLAQYEQGEEDEQ